MLNSDTVVRFFKDVVQIVDQVVDVLLRELQRRKRLDVAGSSTVHTLPGYTTSPSALIWRAADEPLRTMS